MVVAAGRRQDAVDETARMIPDGRGVSLNVDVTEPDSVSALYKSITEKFGRLDLLFNNAGVDIPGIAIDEVRFEDWSRILAPNLTGQFLCAQGAFRLTKAAASLTTGQLQRMRHGRILFPILPANMASAVADNAIAVRRPIPLPAPVTNAIFSVMNPSPFMGVLRASAAPAAFPSRRRTSQSSIRRPRRWQPFNGRSDGHDRRSSLTPHRYNTNLCSQSRHTRNLCSPAPPRTIPVGGARAYYPPSSPRAVARGRSLTHAPERRHFFADIVPFLTLS
jgi:hypothetical protein